MKDTNEKKTELSVEQMLKKEWVTPEMTEMCINGGAASGVPEFSGQNS